MKRVVWDIVSVEKISFLFLNAKMLVTPLRQKLGNFIFHVVVYSIWF